MLYRPAHRRHKQLPDQPSQEQCAKQCIRGVACSLTIKTDIISLCTLTHCAMCTINAPAYSVLPGGTQLDRRSNEPALRTWWCVQCTCDLFSPLSASSSSSSSLLLCLLGWSNKALCIYDKVARCKSHHMTSTSVDTNILLSGMFEKVSTYVWHSTWHIDDE